MMTALALFRDEVREVWWPTLRVLEEVASKERVLQSQEEVLENWRFLGLELGLSESKERSRFQKTQDEARKVAVNCCAWTACQYNKEKPSGKLRVCGGCGEVGYCSRECQKACALSLSPV